MLRRLCSSSSIALHSSRRFDRVSTSHFRFFTQSPPRPESSSQPKPPLNTASGTSSSRSGSTPGSKTSSRSWLWFAAILVGSGAAFVFAPFDDSQLPRWARDIRSAFGSENVKEEAPKPVKAEAKPISKPNVEPAKPNVPKSSPASVKPGQNTVKNDAAPAAKEKAKENVPLPTPVVVEVKSVPTSEGKSDAPIVKDNVSVDIVPVSPKKDEGVAKVEIAAPPIIAPELTEVKVKIDVADVEAEEAKGKEAQEKEKEAFTALQERLARLETALEANDRRNDEQRQRLVHEFEHEHLALHDARRAELAQLADAHRAEVDTVREEAAKLRAKIENDLREEYAANAQRLEHDLRDEYAMQLEKTTAQLSVNASSVYADLRAQLENELGSLQHVLDELVQRLNANSSNVESLIAQHGTARNALDLALAVQHLRSQLDGGGDAAQLGEAIARVEQACAESNNASEAYGTVLRAFQALPATMRRGHETTQSKSALAQQLGELEPQARRAASSSSNSNAAVSALKEWLVQPPSGLVQGVDAASVLARARFYAERGALSEALREIDSLPAPALQVVAVWRQQAAQRVQLDDAFELAQSTLDAHAAALRDAQRRSSSHVDDKKDKIQTEQL